MKTWNPASATPGRWRYRTSKLVIALSVVIALVATTTNVAQAQARPTQPTLCFLIQGSNRTLTLVAAPDDNATHYQVAKVTNGKRRVVHTFKRGEKLNMKIGSGGHLVRSKNSKGTSRWLQCNSYRTISFVSTGRLRDDQRPDVTVGVGLSGDRTKPANGSTSYRRFGGDDGDFVIVDVADRSLEPNGKSMAWQAKFRISEADLKLLQNAKREEYSWNIMQRGLASDPGGQWKMSLVSDGRNGVRVQCTTRAEKGSRHMLQIDSEYDVSKARVRNGMTQWIYATCFSDDSARSYANGVRGDGLQMVVNGVANAKLVKPDLGKIDPNFRGMCGGRLNAKLFPRGFGYVVTIGNKPNCDGPITQDDRFRGDIAFGAVFKQ